MRFNILDKLFSKTIRFFIALSGINKDSTDLLARFYRFYGHNCRKELVFLFIGAVVSGIIELLGLILLYVLIRLMIDIKSIGDNHWILKVFHATGMENRNLIIPFFGGSILLIFIVKNIYIIFYYDMQHRTLRKWKTEISNYLMERYLHSSYFFLLSYNSAVIIRNVNSTVGAALNGFILSALNYASNIITGFILLSILYVKYMGVTLLMACILVLSTVLQNKFLKNAQIKLGREREELTTEQTKNVYQGLHAVKETKVVGKEKYFVNIFKDINTRSIDNEMKTLFYARLPAHLTEIVIIISVLLITVSVLLDTSGNMALSVSSLGVLAAVAFRMAPIMNRTVSALQAINTSSYSMKVLFNEIDKLRSLQFYDDENIEKMPFKKEIKLRKVCFSYPKITARALLDVDLTIKKGEFVGIVGPSGAGKTTLVDIILGLLRPATGHFFVDDTLILPENARFWQKNIGYVPQNIYIGDNSIAENIAFGVDFTKIDRDRVWKVLEDVRMKDFVEGLPGGMDFVVGENGKNLSGGQRQRLGIARALYLEADVLVLDEATAALDVPTEAEISSAINKVRGEKTIIVIAHRLSTVFDADKIVYVENAQVVDVGTYKELFTRNTSFNHMAKIARIEPI